MALDKMTSFRTDYLYLESGYWGTWLLYVEVRVSTDGEKSVVIPCVSQLHDLMAERGDVDQAFKFNEVIRKWERYE